MPFSKKNLIFIVAFLSSYQLLASDSLPLPTADFEIKAEHALDKMHDVVLSPEDFLKNYQPEGARITHKSVSGNQIQFDATKTILHMSKTVFVKGTVASKEEDSLCPGANSGYFATMDFAGSDDLLTDNFDRLEMVICITEKTSDVIAAHASGKMIKGSNYGGIYATIAKDMINDQVDPLVAAIKKTIAEKP